MKILVIDDEPDVLDVVSTRLGEAGYQVLSASSGETGLAMAKAERPDLIVLDIVMPVINGAQVLRLLKQDSELAEIPVVVLTARGSDAQARTAVELGAVCCLFKPYQATVLLDQIRLAIKKSRCST